METLDVTQIEPRLKHPTIFERFDALSSGQAFVIHNDHDPKPLYYQLIAERGEVFKWEYLLNGPEIWEIKITKLNTSEKPVKRNENLIALSHEHHHGLVFCSRLKKADKTDDITLKRFVKDFWDNHLSVHFKSEENILLPYFGDSEIAKRFLSEHKQIRDLAKGIMEEKGSPKENSLKLGELIKNHIRFEERTMFPWLENEVLTAAELAIIGEKLGDTESSSHRFTPEFWKK